MKLKFFTLLLVPILMTVFAVPAFAQGPDGGELVFGDNLTIDNGETFDQDVVVFGGNVTVKNGSTVDGDMVAFGGNFTVDSTSKVDGDVAVLGGNVTIDGTVNGNIAAIGGNVTVAEGAKVDGDIALLGGKSTINGVVRGDIKNLTHFGDGYGQDEQESFGFPEPPTPPQPPSFEYKESPFSGFFGLVGRLVADVIWTIALLITLGLITWLVSAFMPEQMYTVRRTVTESWPASFGLGLITMLVASVVGVVLLITICFAFIPIIAWVLLAIASLFGWIVIGQIFGERLLVASGRSNPNFIMSSIVGVLILAVLTNMPVVGLIPCIGWILGFIGGVVGLLISLTGLGAVLLTRFGTKPYPGPGYAYAGSPTTPPPSSAGRPSGSGSPLRWTEPAPDVSEEETPSSEDDLNARIKAALAEADEEKPSPDDEPSDTPPEPGNDEEPEKSL
jgi:cytoskeletal protein CcmA (bactofilin family)